MCMNEICELSYSHHRFRSPVFVLFFPMCCENAHEWFINYTQQLCFFYVFVPPSPTFGLLVCERVRVQE